MNKMIKTEQLTKNWFQRIKLFLTKGKKEALEDLNESDRDRIYSKYYQDVGEWKFTHENLSSKQDFMNEITEDGKALRRIGVEDGKQGLNPLAMKKITENIASLWHSFIESSFKSNLIKSRREEESEASHHEALENEYQSLIAHKKVIDTHYKYHYKDYNRSLGIFYILIAICLVIADYPLSIHTVTEGFIINKPLDSILLAIGIVLMTVYIKIMYDQYIGNSVQKTILNNRLENILGEGNIATIEEQRQAKKIKKRQLIVKFSILILLIITIVMLGFLRFEASLVKALKDGGGYKEVIKSSEAKFSFIFIALIFPLVGGICASLGFNHLANVRERKITSKDLKKLQKIKEKSLQNLVNIKGNITDFEEHLNWVNKENSPSENETNNFLSDYSSYFFSCYLHGYDKGIHESLSDDLYDSSLNVRNKTIASAVFNSLITNIKTT